MSASGQREMFEKSYEQEVEEKSNGRVECLGMTFPNDEERLRDLQKLSTIDLMPRQHLSDFQNPVALGKAEISAHLGQKEISGQLE